MERGNWYFTFGDSQLLPKGYVAMKNMTFNESRNLMCSFVGNKWSMQYDEQHFEGQPQRYGLVCVRTCTRADLPGHLREHGG